MGLKILSLCTLFVILLFILNACAMQEPKEKIVYITTPLTLPEKPELPKMSADALECISDESKWTLLKRDVLLKNYISDLETIIKATQ
jgi:hypothetical protein